MGQAPIILDRSQSHFRRSEQDVWVAYGERYAAQFNKLYRLGQPNARLAAFKAGRRALSYLVRARAFDRLGSFAGNLVTSTNNPALVRGIIDELQSVADQIPPGRDRWNLRTYLADAIWMAGQPDQSLTLYEQAAAEAEAAEHWSDVARICGNWAGPLSDCGQLDASRAKYTESAAVERKAGNPEVNAVGSELEALRIDVMQGRAEAVLPEIASRLDRVRQWWQKTRAGQSVPAAPDAVVLGRTDQWPQHDLAAVVYWLCAGHGEHVKTWLRNLAIRIRRAAAAGGRYELPRLADLLAQAAFAPPATWLAASQIDLDQLQARIDRLVEQTRRQA